ncbi:adenylate kinase [Kurthia sibirica]|uniref:Adenylate kinase n=1 Tax=Kurthia sibirica TaxID=202750 RepID=A0A2U3AK64_9BACL|nr:adenylate kinase [Kurthia sibirica]PWI24930.1 adenylate kinase [Kurthia sibirica]GEK33159.1 adenylate kinase [Kurthia sibirica]
MKKIIVIGCPGAGKSTFSRKLTEKINIPLFYLDLLWHKKDRSHRTPSEFDADLTAIMADEKWIIDGNYDRTIPMRLEQCDTVFLLDYPLELCLDGAKSRIGNAREDLPWTEMTFDEEFKQWILDFPQKSLPQIYSWLNEIKDKDIIIFKSREQAAAFLENL